jgi:TonB-linked SusC/RagA family outer membrane protein
LLLVILISSTLQAQTKTLIRGIVKLKTDGLPMVGVSVMEVDKENRFINGTTTDANGNFALKVISTENKISFAFIGYKTITESIAGRTEINVILEEDVTEIGEVQIVAKPTVGNGFTNIDEKELTTTIKKIDAKELQDIPSASIDDALQGRLAGVDIVANSGDPGAGMSIKIRGMASLTGNTDPLIVVDNVPIETRLSTEMRSDATQEKFAELLNLSPDDIKDINIQVDAAATAIWGTRGANGIILITTKRGSKSKVAVNYSYRGTLSVQPKTLPMLNGDQYKTLILEEYMNAYDQPLNVNTYREFRNDPADGSYYYNYSQNTNWIKEITQNGRIHDHNLSFTGGGEKAAYRMSVGYWDQKGTTVGTNMKRISTLLNIDYQVSDRIRFASDIRYTHINNNKNYIAFNYDGTKKKEYPIRDVAYTKMPNMSIYEYDDLGNITSNYFSPATSANMTFPVTYNPVAMVNEAKNQVVNENIVPTFRVSYAISKSVNFNSEISFTIDNNKTSKFLPQVASGLLWNQNYVNVAEYEDLQTYNVYSNSRLSFKPDLGKDHSLVSTLGITTNNGNGYWLREASTNGASSELQDPIVASKLFNTETWAGLYSSKSKYKNYAAFAFINYTYLERYSANFSIRTDADPKYGSKYMYGTFVGLGAKWRLSQEEFMKQFAFINDLGIRGNYGINGNASVNADKYAKYVAYGYEYAGETGIYPSNLELQNFRWEKKIQRNIGFNLSVLNSRINLDFTAFNDKIKDGFVPDQGIPSTSGFSTVDINLLNAHNKGFEIDLRAGIIQKKDFNVDVRFNCGWSQFIVDNVSDQATVDLEFTPTKGGEFQYYPRDHTPLGSIFGYKYEGVYKDLGETVARDAKGNPIYDPKGLPVYMRYNYPDGGYIFQPGDAKYEDINHDGNINYNDIVYLGNSNPTLTGGFGSSIRYKSWYCDLFFNFRYNYKIVNKVKINTEKMSDYSNQSAAVLKRWRNPGDETDIPRAVYSSPYNWFGSDRYVEDGSFLRLKQITMGYNLSKELISKIGLKECKLNLTISNLLTFTKYTGQDPEVNISTKVDNKLPRMVSEDVANTPRSKEFTLGITVGF